MARRDGAGDGPGPLPAIVGGVLAAVALLWIVGVVIGTIVLVVRLAVIVGIVWAVLRLWALFRRD